MMTSSPNLKLSMMSFPSRDEEPVAEGILTAATADMTAVTPAA